MKATVIMPVYNAEKTISETITSILNQTYTDFEFLIIDDRSTDQTVECIKTFHDPRIKLIQLEKNVGDALAMNEGIRVARGEYIFRMDGDDISLPQRLEKQIAFMDSHPQCAVCGSFVQMFGASQGVISSEVTADLVCSSMLFYNPIFHPSVVMRADFLRAHNHAYTHDFPHTEDYDLWARIILNGDVMVIPEVLLQYRVHPNQISWKHKEAQMNNAISIATRQHQLYFGKLSEEHTISCGTVLKKMYGVSMNSDDIQEFKNTCKYIIERNTHLKILDQDSLVFICNKFLRML